MKEEEEEEAAGKLPDAPAGTLVAAAGLDPGALEMATASSA